MSAQKTAPQPATQQTPQKRLVNSSTWEAPLRVGKQSLPQEGKAQKDSKPDLALELEAFSEQR